MGICLHLETTRGAIIRHLEKPRGDKPPPFVVEVVGGSGRGSGIGSGSGSGIGSGCAGSGSRHLVLAVAIVATM